MRLIDADELLTAFPVDDEPMLTKSSVRMTIKHMPTVEAEPVRHGHWNWFDGLRCSVCNYKLQSTGIPSCCPNCGAKMDEVEQNG